MTITTSTQQNKLLWLTSYLIKDYIILCEVAVAPVAQLDRALVYGTEGWGFESLQARLLYCLAYSLNPDLEGLIDSSLTIVPQGPIFWVTLSISWFVPFFNVTSIISGFGEIPRMTWFA
jgi:hypothetical protein